MGGGKCRFSWEDDGAVLHMHGLGGAFKTPTEPLYLGNAGTAARFLTTCATLICEKGKASTLTGDRRMKER
jgi:pentafunctional AROM polypeptide